MKQMEEDSDKNDLGTMKRKSGSHVTMMRKKMRRNYSLVTMMTMTIERTTRRRKRKPALLWPAPTI